MKAMNYEFQIAPLGQTVYTIKALLDCSTNFEEFEVIDLNMQKVSYSTVEIETASGLKYFWNMHKHCLRAILKELEDDIYECWMTHTRELKVQDRN